MMVSFESSIYKGGNKDKSNPNQAITLTSVVGKLFEKVILTHIQNYIDNKNTCLPNPLQFGFVKEHGSIPAIYTL